MLDAMILGTITGIGVVAFLSRACRRLDRQQNDLAGDLNQLGADDDDGVFPFDLKGGDDMRGVRRLIVRARKLFDADRIAECRAALEKALDRLDAVEDRRLTAALESIFEDRHANLDDK